MSNTYSVYVDDTANMLIFAIIQIIKNIPYSRILNIYKKQFTKYKQPGPSVLSMDKV